MKRPEKQKRLSLFGVVLFIFGCIWVVAQSNANDGPLVIDTDKYTAVQNIQQIHLNASDTSTSSSDVMPKQKMGLVNSGATLGIGTVQGNRVEQKNTTSVGASVIGGVGNKSQGKTSSLILGGSGNTIVSSVSNSVVMGGNSNTVNQGNSVVLVSSGITTQGSGAISIASEGGKIINKYSIMLGAKDSSITNDSSMVIGDNVQLSQPGTFVFSVQSGVANNNGQSSNKTYKPHTFIIDAENGLIVGTNKNENSSIKLTVNGAVRIGEPKGKDYGVRGAIFRKKCTTPRGVSCLCANIGGSPKSISSNPACEAVCKGESKSCPWNVKCGARAKDYALAETNWRANETYCGTGSHPDSTPDFPKKPFTQAGWNCISDFFSGAVKNCTATHGCNKCGLKGFPYCFDVTFDPNAPECGGGGG